MQAVDYVFIGSAFWEPGIGGVRPLCSQVLLGGHPVSWIFLLPPFPVHREFERMFRATGCDPWPAATPTGEGGCT